jgi:hypothetical protein
MHRQRGRNRTGGILPALNLDFINAPLSAASVLTVTSAGGLTYLDAEGATQTAAANQARLDHVPVTLARRGLRIDAGETVTLPLSSVPGFSGTRGTLLVEVEFPAITAAGMWAASVDNGVSTQRITLFRAAAGALTATVFDGTTQAALTDGVARGAGVYRMAVSWVPNDFAFSYGGNAPILDTLGSVPTVSVLRLGASPAGTLNLTGWLRRVVLLNRDATDAQLQAVTA